MSGTYSDALDQKYAALALSRRVAPKFEAGNAYRTSFGRYERWALQNSETFWWAEDITDVVWQSALSLPSDTLVSNERLSNGKKCGWMWFERARHIDGLEPFGGILWFMDKFADGNPAICVTTYGLRDNGAPEALDTVHIFEGKSIGEIESEMSANVENQHRKDALKAWGGEAGSNAIGGAQLLRFFVSSALWIQQAILAVSAKPAERHALKRAQKIEPEGPKEINVIALRRKHYQQDSTGGTSEPIEWSCRWLVSGHWRNQYHPSTSERVPTWIMPYVKGPEDKPLKAPLPTVFAVTR